MIRFTVILSALVFALNVSYAQSFSDIKGPAAKNYKPWEQQARKGSIFLIADKPVQKGPEFKNKKVWSEEQPKIPLSTDLKTIEGITGPKAKNQKPWKRD